MGKGRLWGWTLCATNRVHVPQTITTHTGCYVIHYLTVGWNSVLSLVIAAVWQEIRVGWGSDADDWETSGHHWLHVWIDKGTTGRQLYNGFRRAGAPCTDARVVREPAGEEAEGVGALAFRQVVLGHRSCYSHESLHTNVVIISIIFACCYVASTTIVIVISSNIDCNNNDKITRVREYAALPPQFIVKLMLNMVLLSYFLVAGTR
jgi:hypothetical protein